MAPTTHAHRARSDAKRPATQGRTQRRTTGSAFADLQRDIGNRAVGRLIQTEKDDKAAKKSKSSVYETAAAKSTGMPDSVVAVWSKEAVGSPEKAVAAVVAEMIKRGEIDPKLLRTQGDGPLWSINPSADPGANVRFSGAFADPDEQGRRLPNPRFVVSSKGFEKKSALARIHLALFHEFRHVRQQYERVNAAGASPEQQEAGYCNDPDEFDAYLSEVEAAYSYETMLDPAIQAAVNWTSLSELQRRPFKSRWEAAAKRIKEMLHYTVEQLLETAPAKQYQQVCETRAAAGRAAAASH